MAGNSSQPGRSVVSKFSAILMTFRQGGSHSLSEIASLSGLPISTTHRMVNDLSDWLVLEKDCDGRTYRPGLALKSLLASTCCLTRNLRDRAAPWLEDLHRAVNADVRLGIPEVGAVSYIEKRRGCAVSQFSPAATMPVHATAGGKVLLAFTPDRELRQILNRRLTAFTPRTIVDPDQLRWVLKKARVNGFAVADRELRSDSTAIAAPIFGAGGRIVAALEVDVGDAVSALDCVRPALSVAAAGLSREFERPCEHCQTLVAGGEERSELRAQPADRRGPRRSAGPASVPVPVDEVRSIQWLDRRNSTGRSPTVR
ncbi:MAG TPA: IclR family transcriptional regulator [Nakamurella sp.]